MAELRVVTIAFVHKQTGEIRKGNIIQLFKKFETMLVIHNEWLYKRVYGRLMRLHAYEWPIQGEEFVVVPFGTMKEYDKPMGLNRLTQRLKDFDEDMFDVNCLAYDARSDVALLTVSRPGPSMRSIEDYLNQFIPRDYPYEIQIDPVLRDARLARMRDSREARELEVTLDLGRPLHKLFREQITEEQGIAAALKTLASVSKDQLASRTFTLTLGLGHARKSSMDVGALIEMLDEINLDDEAIKEIKVRYRDKSTDKLETVYAKNTKVTLSLPFDYEGRVPPEVLRQELDHILYQNRARYFQQVQELFGIAELAGSDYELIRKELQEDGEHTQEHANDPELVEV